MLDNIKNSIDRNQYKDNEEINDITTQQYINNIIADIEDIIEDEPDESGKYTYTINDNMYTYKDNHTSSQTQYNISKESYTTELPDNTTKIIQNMSNSNILQNNCGIKINSYGNQEYEHNCECFGVGNKLTEAHLINVLKIIHDKYI